MSLCTSSNKNSKICILLIPVVVIINRVEQILLDIEGMTHFKHYTLFEPHWKVLCLNNDSQKKEKSNISNITRPKKYRIRRYPAKK